MNNLSSYGKSKTLLNLVFQLLLKFFTFLTFPPPLQDTLPADKHILTVPSSVVRTDPLIVHSPHLLLSYLPGRSPSSPNTGTQYSPPLCTLQTEELHFFNQFQNIKKLLKSFSGQKSKITLNMTFNYFCSFNFNRSWQTDWKPS